MAGQGRLRAHAGTGRPGALTLDRARATWQKRGRSEKWISQRMTGQETRAKLTDYWDSHEVKRGQKSALLTNLIHEEWTGLGVKDHKQLKTLKTQHLRDHMSEAAWIFTALAELSTPQIAEATQASGLPANKVAARSGGAIAKRTRLVLESQTGKKMASEGNHLPPARAKRLKKLDE